MSWHVCFDTWVCHLVIVCDMKNWLMATTTQYIIMYMYIHLYMYTLLYMYIRTYLYISGNMPQEPHEWVDCSLAGGYYFNGFKAHHPDRDPEVHVWVQHHSLLLVCILHSSNVHVWRSCTSAYVTFTSMTPVCLRYTLIITGCLRGSSSAYTVRCRVYDGRRVALEVPWRHMHTTVYRLVTRWVACHILGTLLTSELAMF